MSMESEASNQVLSMTLEGVKITAQLTGKVTKEIAIAFLAAIRSIVQKYKAKKQLTPGQQKLINMIQSGKPLNQFVITNDQLDTVRSEAIKRGITFSAVKNKKDGISYITVYQQDAARINRLLEDIGVGDVDYINMRTEPTEEPTVEVSSEEPSTTETEQQSTESVSEQHTDSAEESTGSENELTNDEIDDIFESFDTIESEGENPLEQAAKIEEAPSKNSSPLIQVEGITDIEKDGISKESQDHPFADGFSNSAASRPSIKKRVDEIVRQQQADKASKMQESVEKVKEAADNIKEMVNK